MSFNRTATLMMRPTRILLEGANWREKMPYSRYVAIATRSLHKGVTEKESAKYIKFSETGFEALRQIPGGNPPNEPVENVPNTYEKM